MKQEHLAFIKAFSKINVSSICKELNINRENVLHGKASAEAIKNVYDELNRRIKDLLNNDII